MQSQGLLFSELSVAETGVWCELSNGVDPADWVEDMQVYRNLKPCRI